MPSFSLNCLLKCARSVNPTMAASVLIGSRRSVSIRFLASSMRSPFSQLLKFMAYVSLMKFDRYVRLMPNALAILMMVMPVCKYSFRNSHAFSFWEIISNVALLLRSIVDLSFGFLKQGTKLCRIVKMTFLRFGSIRRFCWTIG